MHFKDWLKERGLTMKQFAAKIGDNGLSQNYLSEIASFKKEPKLRVAYDIHIASGRVIPVDYWITKKPFVSALAAAE